MKKHFADASGFSLVEVALSLAILAVGMTAVLALLPVGLESARQVEAETVVASVAQTAFANLATNAQSSARWAWLIQPGNGEERMKEYWLVDGTRPNSADNPKDNLNEDRKIKYFELQFLKMTHTANSCRYMLHLRWPLKAVTNNPNGPLVQKRSFVTEIRPAF